MYALIYYILASHTMTNILVIGDPHFKVSNIPEVDEFVCKTLEIARLEKPKFIVICGDVLHTHERIHVTPMNRALKFINDLRGISEVYILVGNHDMCLAVDTPVKMFDGSLKFSQDIVVGDGLVSDTRQKTIVMDVVTGSDFMYTVYIGKKHYFSVNRHHQLTIVFEVHLDSVHAVLRLLDPKKGRLHMRLIEIILSYTDATPIRKIIDIPIVEYDALRRELKEYMFALYSSGELSRFSVNLSRSSSRYYGFSVSGDSRRFELGNGIITHNCNNQQFLTENHWMTSMKEWKNVRIIDSTFTETIGDDVFTFVPYVQPGRFLEALSKVGSEWEKSSVIFAHQEFMGCNLGGKLQSTLGDVWDSDSPVVVSGHIHERHWIGENVFYPGSALQHTYGEEGHDKTLSIVTVVGDEISIRNISLDLPRKRIVYVDLTEFESYNFSSEKDDVQFVKVVVTGSIEKYKSVKKTVKYKTLVNCGMKIVFRPTVKNTPLGGGGQYLDETHGCDWEIFMNTVDEEIKKEKSTELCLVYDEIKNRALVM